MRNLALTLNALAIIFLGIAVLKCQSDLNSIEESLKEVQGWQYSIINHIASEVEYEILEPGQ
jgi:uncharacterized protein YoxC